MTNTAKQRPALDKNSRIYFASKVKHAGHWQQLAKNWSLSLSSSWVYQEQRLDRDGYTSLWDLILLDMQNTDLLIAHLAPGEVPKGMLVEVGMALALGIPVWVLTEEDDFSPKEEVMGTWVHKAGVKFLDWRAIAGELGLVFHTDTPRPSVVVHPEGLYDGITDPTVAKRVGEVIRATMALANAASDTDKQEAVKAVAVHLAALGTLASDSLTKFTALQSRMDTLESTVRSLLDGRLR